ncbi:MAG TPA: hypothetical protein DDZ51_19720 [Planctomycetaceae bacterium]|nr:hypothetical protein [Planctomycetaceae bacterium]
MKSLSIIGLTILACVIYGIIHDQVTVRLCLEYFTVFHAPMFETLNPTLLGIGWGILATWWVGLILGIPLAVFARAGKMPKRTAAQLIRPITILMLSSACFAIMAGTVGFIAALNGWIWMVEPWVSRVPSEHHIPFLVCYWTHNASYIAGFVGGITVMAIVWRGRLLELQRGKQEQT